MLSAAIVAVGTAIEMNEPYMAKNDCGFDPCASTRGLHLYGGTVGAASMNSACSP